MGIKAQYLIFVFLISAFLPLSAGVVQNKEPKCLCLNRTIEEIFYGSAAIPSQRKYGKIQLAKSIENSSECPIPDPIAITSVAFSGGRKVFTTEQTCDVFTRKK